MDGKARRKSSTLVNGPACSPPGVLPTRPTSGCLHTWRRPAFRSRVIGQDLVARGQGLLFAVPKTPGRLGRH